MKPMPEGPALEGHYSHIVIPAEAGIQKARNANTQLPLGLEPLVIIVLLTIGVR